MNVEHLLSDTASGLLRTALTAILSYLALVVLLRITGKRTVSKWNAFDLIVTVGIGSMLASTVLSQSISIMQGLVGLSVLIGLQLVVTWASVRSDRVEQLVKARPTLLLRHGQLIDEAMRRERVPAEEIRAAVRRSGHGSIEQIAAAILETDGSISIIAAVEHESDSALAGVVGWDQSAAVGQWRST